MGSSSSSQQQQVTEKGGGGGTLRYMANLDPPVEQVAACNFLISSPEAFGDNRDTAIEKIRRDLETFLDQHLRAMVEQASTEESPLETLLVYTHTQLNELVIRPETQDPQEDLLNAVFNKRVLDGCYLQIFVALCLFHMYSRWSEGQLMYAPWVEKQDYAIRLKPDGSMYIILEADATQKRSKDQFIPLFLDLEDMQQLPPLDHAWPYLITWYVDFLYRRRTPLCDDNFKTLGKYRAACIKDIQPPASAADAQAQQADPLMSSNQSTEQSIEALVKTVEEEEDPLMTLAHR